MTLCFTAQCFLPHLLSTQPLKDQPRHRLHLWLLTTVWFSTEYSLPMCTLAMNTVHHPLIYSIIRNSPGLSF